MARQLVIQLSRLGDVIQSTPLLQDWMKRRPDDEIDVLVQELNRPAIETFTALHRVIGLDCGKRYHQTGVSLAEGLKKNQPPPEATALLKDLDLPHYETVVNLSYDLLPCWLAGRLSADRLLGGYVNREGEWMFAGAAQVYLAALLDFRELNWFNLVDLWRAAAPAGPVPTTAAQPFVAMASNLPFSLPAGKIIALNPGSASAVRRWPPVFFARLAERLHERGFVPILVGAPGDRDVCAELAGHCGLQLDNFCGLTSVPEMARLLAQCALLVSVDTGALHIAAAVGTPVVGLYGARACFRETAPWSAGHLLLQAPLHTDISGLPPDTVFAACLNRLGMLEEELLKRQLAGSQATAWETSFLAPGVDPLGGLGYRAMHGQRSGAGDFFLQALRHVLACEFCGQALSVAVSDKGEKALPVVVDEGELQEVLDAAATAASLCDSLARGAAEAVQLSRQGRSAATRLRGIVSTMTEAFETLKGFSDQTCGARLNPVLRFLDWDFRMMPMLPPAETFLYYRSRYQWTAAALMQAAQACRIFSADGRRT